MSFAPLLDAAPAIELRPFAAMTRLCAAAWFNLGPEGHAAASHDRVDLGSTLMALSACSFVLEFHQLRLWGPWRPIDLVSIFTLAMLPLAVWAAHRHAVDRHRRAMTGLFFGALVIAGLFTLMPGRIMHKVVFGG